MCKLSMTHTHTFPSVCHCTGVHSIPFVGLVVRFPRQLQKDWRAVQTCFFWGGASKSAHRRRKSVGSMLNLSAKCAPGNTTVHSFSFMILQLEKWFKFSFRICVSHRLSLVLNAFTVLYMSEITCPCQCSYRLNTFKWLSVSHRNGISHMDVSFWSSVVYFSLSSMNRSPHAAQNVTLQDLPLA